MVKVSVLVPVYNTSANEFKTCIDSLLQQEFEQYEIIIVDDGSAFCAVREGLLEGYLLDSRVTLIRHSNNKGLPSARNSALEMAKGDYVVHVDSDDFWITNDVLATLYETALVDCCDVLRFNGQFSSDGRLGQPVIRKFDCVNRSLTSEPRLRVFRSVFLFFCRRQFLLDNDLRFNPNIHIGEDAVYVSKLLASTVNISSISRMFYAYSIDNTSMMRRPWSYTDFVDENNSVIEVAKNLSSYPKIVESLIRYRYNRYMLKALYPRALMDLRRAEINKLGALYVKTKSDLEAVLGTRMPVGRLFQISSWYYYSSRGARFDGLVTTVLNKIYPRAKRYYKFFGVNWILPSIRHRIRQFFSKFGIMLPRKPGCKRPVENIEGLSEYNLLSKNSRSTNKEKGLSVMLRVKNEELNIVASIESIIDLSSEVVVVDNNSTDKTVELVRQMICNHAGGDKIKIYHYPFRVARCGAEHDETPEDSVHNLAYYYNWCLDKCSYKAVIKWDADMVVSMQQGKRAEFKELVDKVVNARLHTAINFLTQTYYLSRPNEGYLAKNEINGEIRIFSTSASIFFIKVKNFEQLAMFSPTKIIRSQSNFSFELKRLGQNEFAHWSSMSFSAPRKVAEYRSFRRLTLFGGGSAKNDYYLSELSEL